LCTLPPSGLFLEPRRPLNLFLLHRNHKDSFFLFDILQRHLAGKLKPLLFQWAVLMMMMMFEFMDQMCGLIHPANILCSSLRRHLAPRLGRPHLRDQSMMKKYEERMGISRTGSEISPQSLKEAFFLSSQDFNDRWILTTK
jgi:hypothetical protein